jgi:hypothetical protein
MVSTTAASEESPHLVDAKIQIVHPISARPTTQ